MRVFTTVLAAFCLFACSDSPQLIEQDFERTQIELTVKIYPTYEAMQEAVKKEYGKTHSPHTTGFAMWYTDGTDCTIYVVKPKKEKEFVNWGHELGHCVYGSWH